MVWTSKHHKGMIGGIWVRYPTPVYDNTPTGWLEATLAQVENFMEEKVNEIVWELQSSIGSGIEKVTHGLQEFLEQEKQQLEYDFGIVGMMAQPPTTKEIIEKALDYIDIEDY